MHAEQQATTLWCPMVRLDNQIGGTGNRGQRQTYDHPHPEQMKCIAGQCAMWRWAEPEPVISRFHYYSGQGDQRPKGCPDNYEWIPKEADDEFGGTWLEPMADFEARRQRELNSRKGYCGLAGKPVV